MNRWRVLVVFLVACIWFAHEYPDSDVRGGMLQTSDAFAQLEVDDGDARDLYADRLGGFSADVGGD